MPVRQTSIEAYHHLENTGKSRTQRFKILHAIVNGTRRDYTRQELVISTGLSINAVCGRVNELLKDGVIQEDGTRQCSITGSNANVLKAVSRGT